MSGSSKSGRTQLVSGRGMPRDIDAQATQLLNQPPYLRPTGGNFLCNLGAADDDRRMLHQQANDQPQPRISLRHVARSTPVRDCVRRTSFAGPDDAEIIGESR